MSCLVRATPAGLTCRPEQPDERRNRTPSRILRSSTPDPARAQCEPMVLPGAIPAGVAGAEVRAGRPQRRLLVHCGRPRQVGPRLPDHGRSGPRQALPRQPELGRHQQHLFLDRSEPRHRRRDPAAVPAVCRRQGAGSLRCVRARRLPAGERRALEHDPEKPCPGPDPGRAPVFGKDHAPTIVFGSIRLRPL